MGRENKTSRKSEGPPDQGGPPFHSRHGRTRRLSRMQRALASTNPALLHALELASKALQHQHTGGASWAGSPGGERSAREVLIRLFGALLRSKLAKASYPFPSRTTENQTQRLILERSEEATLGSAWLQAGQSTRPFWEEFERQFYDIVSDPPTVSREISVKAARRARYFREKEGTRFRSWDRLHAEMRDWLLGRIAIGHGASTEPQDQVATKLCVEGWQEALTPAERAALGRMLNQEPTAGSADRQARSRVKKKLRELTADE